MNGDRLRGEEWARERLEKLEPIIFPDGWASDERSVSGEFLTEAILNPVWGSIPGGFHIKNAIIRTPISRRYASWTWEALFEDCLFNAKFQLPYLDAKRRLLFTGCNFRDEFDLRAATLSEIGFLTSKARQQTIFHGPIKLGSCQVSDRVLCVGSLLNADVDFNTASVGGNANFGNTTFGGSLDFKGFRLVGQLDFTNARFMNSKSEVSFNSATILGGAIFDGSEFMAAPDFLGTEFGRRLQCCGAKFASQAEATFQRCRVNGDAIFEDSMFVGPVDFSAIQIKGDLSLRNSVFKNGGKFGSMLVEGNAFYQDAKFHGKSVLSSAQILENLVCERIQFFGETADLLLLALRVTGSVLYKGAIFGGRADFSGATINGQLVLDEAQCTGLLSLNGAKVGRGVFLVNATCNGPVNFVGAEIGGQFACQNARFLSKEETTFSIARLNCDAIFDGAEFRGTLSLTSTIITGQLRCIGAQFLSQQSSFNFNGGSVDGSAVFWNARFQGLANLRGARFSQNLSLAGTRFTGILDLSNAVVEGSLMLFSIAEDAVPSVTVDRTVLPTTANLHRFSYAASDLLEENRWKEWINLANSQPGYDPGPFIALERTFRQAGRGDLADRIYIEMNRAEERFLWKNGRIDKWLAKVVLRMTVGYGAYGWLLWLWALPILMIFFAACRISNLSPGPIRIAMYTVDVFLPIDLHQQKLCDLPDWLRFITEVWGWLIIPLAIAQLSGYLQRTSVPRDK